MTQGWHLGWLDDDDDSMSKLFNGTIRVICNLNAIVAIAAFICYILRCWPSSSIAEIAPLPFVQLGGGATLNVVS